MNRLISIQPLPAPTGALVYAPYIPLYRTEPKCVATRIVHRFYFFPKRLRGRWGWLLMSVEQRQWEPGMGDNPKPEWEDYQWAVDVARETLMS